MDVSPTVTPREKDPIRPLNDDYRFDPRYAV